MEYKRLFYINIIYKCNNKCIYCISHSTMNHTYSNFDALKLIVDTDAAYNLNESDIFIICGGEPTISPQFTDIVLFLTKKKCHIIIYTNGRKLKNDKIRNLIQETKARWIIPLYGLKDTHDYYTGIKGSFSETFDGLTTLQDETAKNYFSIKFLIKSEKQLKEIRELIQILGNKFHEFNFTLILDKNNIEDRSLLAPKISPIIEDLYDRNYTIKIANTPLCCLSNNYKQILDSQYQAQYDKNFNYFYYIGINKTSYVFDKNHFMFEKCDKCKFNKLCVENCLKYLIMDKGIIHLGVE